MAFFGLKLGLDLEMRAAHPHQKFQGVPPRGGPLKHSIHFIEMLPSMQLCGCLFFDYSNFQEGLQYPPKTSSFALNGRRL